jgi:hypothetical protein
LVICWWIVFYSPIFNQNLLYIVFNYKLSAPAVELFSLLPLNHCKRLFIPSMELLKLTYGTLVVVIVRCQCIWPLRCQCALKTQLYKHKRPSIILFQEPFKILSCILTKSYQLNVSYWMSTTHFFHLTYELTVMTSASKQ